MPGMNGTGPQGNGPMSGRGFGRCRMAPDSTAPAEQAPESRDALSQYPQQNTPVFGRGRGGIPRGCGRRDGSGGGRLRQG